MIQVMESSRRLFCLLAAACVLCATSASAQTIRSHTRSAEARESGSVNESQAEELTLTLVQAARQDVQTWIRVAGVLDALGKHLTSCVPNPDGSLVRVGQLVRAFPPDSKSSMYQARVARVTPHDGCVDVDVALSGPVHVDASRYIMEIIVSLGRLLAIPNEAIIEREGAQIVYVQQHPGHYEPREIHTGRKGELYAEVLHGLDEGDQVVTIGSFFVDADYRLKSAQSTEQDDASSAHQHGNAHEHH
jgi:hypothetical protein